MYGLGKELRQRGSQRDQSEQRVVKNERADPTVSGGGGESKATDREIKEITKEV